MYGSWSDELLNATEKEAYFRAHYLFVKHLKASASNNKFIISYFTHRVELCFLAGLDIAVYMRMSDKNEIIYGMKMKYMVSA